ncbi:cell division protein ZapA [Nicoletella semolina]|uniref:Cell division protein ZapA n=1 Tax=Nicoletella semolina TaxID=271160 RepID=A0A4V2SJP0_9PAST|nr:cell division protein ZapA [Nicoletella semolina]
MSKNNIELQIFGQVLRLYCPLEQQEALLASAQRLEERVAILKEQSGIIQLEKVLAIVALNLNYELEQEQRKNLDNKNVLVACLQQLDTSLSQFQSTDALVVGLDTVEDLKLEANLEKSEHSNTVIVQENGK